MSEAPKKFNLMAAAGLGTETIDESVLGMPFLQILQKGSPEFDETHPRHKEKAIAGCKPGDIVFTRESKVLKSPVTLIPIAQQSVYTVWKPKAQGGGFIGVEPLTLSSKQGFTRGVKGTPTEHKEYYNGNEAVLTTYFLVIFLDGAEWKRGLLSLSSVGLRTARLWSRQLLSMKHPSMGDATPPIFSSKWTLKSKIEQNDKGSWFGWDLAKADFLDEVKDEALLTEAMATLKDSSTILPAPNRPLGIATAEVVEADDEKAPF